MRIDDLRDKLRDAYDPQIRNFHELMAHRIKSILMVSNHYESFSMARDASLTSDIYGTSQLLHLQNVPQITTAQSANEALETLRGENYDLVLAWRGSARVLLSIIKLIEDRLNVDRDLELASIGVIIAIEDSPNDYSTLLPGVYATLMERTFRLVPEGINERDCAVPRRGVRPRLSVPRQRPRVIGRQGARAGVYVPRAQRTRRGIPTTSSASTNCNRAATRCTCRSSPSSTRSPR